MVSSSQSGKVLATSSRECEQGKGKGKGKGKAGQDPTTKASNLSISPTTPHLRSLLTIPKIAPFHARRPPHACPSDGSFRFLIPGTSFCSPSLPRKLLLGRQAGPLRVRALLSLRMGGGSLDSPRLLDLLAPGERGWKLKAAGEEGGGSAEETRLELRLWPANQDGSEHPSVLSLGLPSAGAKRAFLELEAAGASEHDPKELQYKQSHEKKACPRAAAAAAGGTAAGAAALGLARPQSRTTANAPVVGWPPVRSFRKNITTASKPSTLPQATEPKKPEGVQISAKGPLLKINMDGIPIGRKIDLNAYKSYEGLSDGVDKLFRDLLAAQREPHAITEGGTKESIAITGLLGGSGEYTLVYEDGDGDRILVGDVPWEMFVSTAKRLRVLRTSQLSTSAWRAAVGSNRKVGGGVL